MKKLNFLCPSHCKAEAETRNENFKLELCDISKGSEAVEVSADLGNIDEIMALPYIYTSKNLDSEHTNSCSVMMDRLPCCDCEYNSLCMVTSVSKSVPPCVCLVVRNP